MKAKERMLMAIELGLPDRLPATIHQWQPYHLNTFMNGMNDIEAFKSLGMDAAITFSPFEPQESKDWKVTTKSYKKDNITVIDYKAETPDGFLTWQTNTNQYTTWVTTHMIKNDEDIYIYKKYSPRYVLDKKALNKYYDILSDDGIMRMFITGYQGGCWQDACELYGVENLIFATFDKPLWVHEFLNILLDKKLEYIYENLKGIKIDLIETGGGAASSTVISPAIHREFCLPYDRKLHDAIHSMGHKVVYHTCGGMMGILDLILENGCDVSETLSPADVGGNISEIDEKTVKDTLGSKIGLIGGMDQINILTKGTPDEIRKEVKRLFAVYGLNGGYIMSACDHFFDAPVDNLKAYADAAKECIY